MLEEKSQKNINYITQGQIKVYRSTENLIYDNAIEPLIDKLDTHRGALFASSFEYPGRYTRWDIGFINPPLEIVSRERNFRIKALNDRGKVLIVALEKAIKKLDALGSISANESEIRGTIKKNVERFAEEFRSKQASIFSVLRTIIDFFASKEDKHLGLFGAFGYDLVFQFETLQMRMPRADDQRDLVLYLPDEIYVIDHRRKLATLQCYDFTFGDQKTADLPRSGVTEDYHPAKKVPQNADHKPGEYADVVRLAHQSFKKGDLFEVVPGQTFFEPCTASPAEVFRRLRERNPSPYGLLINLGDNEYLVGASPEMYVRVSGKRVETCPISGTIKRGENAIEDEAQILTLLNSKKDTSELTMCTDVDRNDKSRICEPGSVQVIGRRQIELYSKLIHTVDHVEGTLRDGYDAMDAFLSHAWVVTVTGAPKLWAMQFIEDHERSPRRWYAGAIGWLGFDGNMNTGLTIRTIRIKNGTAEIRAGATLLYDSDPDAEEKETQLKASAFIDAIRRPRSAIDHKKAHIPFAKSGQGKRILLVDHQDSFVHTLANYLRQTGANITTLRSGFDPAEMKKINPDLVVLSPGPGCPKDFNVTNTIKMALANNSPIFGVCLGLQGLVEYYGGELDILDYPMHGKPSTIHTRGGKLFTGLTHAFTAARYHSLFAKENKIPEVFNITAKSEDGVVMAVEHRTLPLWAVQFHPESILSLEKHVGLRIIFNVLSLVNTRQTQAAT